MYKFIAIIYNIIVEWFMNMIGVFSLAALKKQKEGMVKSVNHFLEGAGDALCEFYDDAVEGFTEIFDHAAKGIKSIASMNIFFKKSEPDEIGIVKLPKFRLNSTELCHGRGNEQLSPDETLVMDERAIVDYIVKRVEGVMEPRRAERDAEFERNRQKARAELYTALNRALKKIDRMFEVLRREQAQWKEDFHNQRLVERLNMDLFQLRITQRRETLFLTAFSERDVQEVKRNSAAPGC
jgi:DNA gyrase/topoisomerase IV subunit A